MSKLWLECGLVLCLVECPKGPHEFCDARSVTTTRWVSRNIVTVTLFEAGAWDRGVALLQNGDGSDVVQTSSQYRTSCIVPNSCLPQPALQPFSVLRARPSPTRLLVSSRAFFPLSSCPLFFFSSLPTSIGRAGLFLHHCQYLHLLQPSSQDHHDSRPCSSTLHCLLCPLYFVVAHILQFPSTEPSGYVSPSLYIYIPAAPEITSRI